MRRWAAAYASTCVSAREIKCQPIISLPNRKSWKYMTHRDNVGLLSSAGEKRQQQMHKRVCIRLWSSKNTRLWNLMLRYNQKYERRASERAHAHSGRQHSPSVLISFLLCNCATQRIRKNAIESPSNRTNCVCVDLLTSCNIHMIDVQIDKNRS